MREASGWGAVGWLEESKAGRREVGRGQRNLYRFYSKDTGNLVGEGSPPIPQGVLWPSPL